MKSIFVRTYIGITLLILAALLATFEILDTLFEQEYAAEFQKVMQIEAEFVRGKLALAPPARWESLVAGYESVFGTDVELLTQAQVSDRWPDSPSPPKAGMAFSKAKEYPWWLLVSVANSDRFLLFQEGGDDSVSETALAPWLERFAPLIAIYLVLTFGVLLLAQRISRPIHELSSTARALGKGDLEVRASTRIPAPIDALALSFNGMADDLQRLITDQQILMGAIPHELRTPLSRVRFALDVTRRLESADDLRNQIEIIDGYVDDLNTTVDEALVITRLGRDEAVLFHPFNLKNLIVDLHESSVGVPTKKVSVQSPLPEEVFGHPDLIKRAIDNVVANALRYAVSNVRVSAHNNDGVITLAVDDDGPGIPEDKRREVFSPFSRMEQSRGRSTGGVGLGLALVEVIMRKHQGTACVGSSPLGGARFELRWDCDRLRQIHTH